MRKIIMGCGHSKGDFGSPRQDERVDQGSTSRTKGFDLARRLSSSQASDGRHHSQLGSRSYETPRLELKFDESLQSESRSASQRVRYLDGAAFGPEERLGKLINTLEEHYETKVTLRDEGVYCVYSTVKGSEDKCCVTLVNPDKRTLTIMPIYGNKDVFFKERGEKKLSALDMHWYHFSLLRVEYAPDAKFDKIILDHIRLNQDKELIEKANFPSLPKDEQILIDQIHPLHSEITQNPHYKEVETMLEKYAPHLKIGKVEAKVTTRSKYLIRVFLEVSSNRHYSGSERASLEISS